MNNDIKKAIVRITYEDVNNNRYVYGTGIIISLPDVEKDAVLTVYHVIDKFDGINEHIIIDSEYKKDGEKTFKIVEVMYDKSNTEDVDVAVIYIEKLKWFSTEDNMLLPKDFSADLNCIVKLAGFPSLIKEEELDLPYLPINVSVEHFERPRIMLAVKQVFATPGRNFEEAVVGMSGGPLYCQVNNKTYLLGVTKKIPTSEDCPYYIFYSWHIRWYLDKIKELYGCNISLYEESIPIPKNIRQLLIDNSRLNYEKFHSMGMPFHDLIINEGIMPGLQIKRDEIIETEIKVNDEIKVTLIEGIKKLWEKEIFHTSVIGEGGMGKTVSLLKLWNIFLEYNSSPIPIYIELNNYNTYYVKSESESLHNRNYIMNVIIKNYLGIEKIADEDRNTLSEIFKVKNGVEGKNIPSIILLLDGLNEVTVTNKDLIYEINEFIKNYSGVQIIITSRYELKNMSQYMRHFNKIELLKLTDDQILNYLNKVELEKPASKIFDLLKNPMMLTIYSITCHMLKINRNINLNLKHKVETYGELMWNYKQAQLMKLVDIEEQFIRYSFVLNHIIPYLGFRMESMGKFELTKKELKNFINEICEKVYCAEFTEAYDMYAGDPIKKLKLGKLDWPDDDDRFNKYMDVNKTLHIIYYTDENKNSIKFSHQNFRDFFAACHVLNEMKINIVKNECLNEKEIPKTLKEKPLSVYVRRCIGEIEEEHHNAPIIDMKGKIWLNGRYTPTLVIETLNNCRHIFDERIGYAVWNLIEILKSTRIDFTGMDLSYLDLRKCLLNGVRFSRWYGNRITKTNFDGSLIDMKIFMNQGHTQEVESVIYSPDGKYILSASGDRTIKEWDKETGECVRTYEGHEDGVNSATYSSDGKYILSASDDETIKEWDRENGECIRTYEDECSVKSTAEDHKSSVESVAYSSDGKYVLSTSEVTIKEWNRETCKCIKTYEDHEYRVKSAAYSSDDKYIVSVSRDGIIKEWNRETHECVRTYEGHKHYVKSVAYSLDSKYILSASDDKTIKEWNRETGECIKTYTGHKLIVNSAVYSSDGKHILSASHDKTIKEWDRETGECIRTYMGHKGYVRSVAYSSDSKYILSASRDETIKEWDRETGECIRTYECCKIGIICAVYSLDGKYILSALVDGTIKEWNRETGQCIKTYEGHKDRLARVVYSSDDKYIVSNSWDGAIKEWDRENGECIRAYEGHKSVVENMTYSSDGKYILSASRDGTVKEWNRETCECIRTYTGHEVGVIIAFYSSDGKYILSLSWNRAIKEWDRGTGECIRTYEGREFGVKRKVYSSDGKYILSESQGTIKEFDRETGECIRTYEDRKFIGENVAYSSNDLGYSSDGKYILSILGDGTIKEWDKGTRKCIRTYEGGACSAAYSPDGKYILSASLDNTIREWYREDTQCSKTIKYMPGLLIEGCTFKNLNAKSNVTNKEKEVLKQHGAVF